MKSLLVSFLLLAFSSSAFADQNFIAKTRILSNGNEIGAPVLRLKPDAESSVSVEDVYDLSLSAIDAGENQVRISIKLTTNGETQSPIMLVEYGEEASFEAHGTAFSVVVVKEHA